MFGSARSAPAAAELRPLAIAEVKRDTPVNFEKEVLPILSKNCLACHNGTKAESGLVLETPQSILKCGKEGPSGVEKTPAVSLFFKSSALLAELTLPPDDNNVGAKPLSPEELGLI